MNKIFSVAVCVLLIFLCASCASTSSSEPEDFNRHEARLSEQIERESDGTKLFSLYEERCRLYIENELYTEAWSDVEKMVELSASESEDKRLFKIGADLIGRSSADYETVENLCNVTLVDYPDYADAYMIRGNARFYSGKLSLAKEDYEKFISMTGGDKLSYIMLGYLELYLVLGGDDTSLLDSACSHLLTSLDDEAEMGVSDWLCIALMWSGKDDARLVKEAERLAAEYPHIADVEYILTFAYFFRGYEGPAAAYATNFAKKLSTNKYSATLQGYNINNMLLNIAILKAVVYSDLAADTTLDEATRSIYSKEANSILVVLKSEHPELPSGNINALRNYISRDRICRNLLQNDSRAPQ